MEKEMIIAMAVAAIAESIGVEIKHVNVLSFKEVKKSSLEQYIENEKIQYHKYQLEDEKA